MTNDSGRLNQSDLLLWIGVGTVTAVGLAWFTLSRLSGTETPTVTGPDPAGLEPAAAAGPATADDARALEAGTSLDNPLRAAQMALDAGMLLEPEAYSAWSLFARALAADPDDAEALAGLETVATALLARGNAAAEQGRYADAEALAHTILAKLSEHSGARVLLERIDSARVGRRETPTAASASPAATVDPPSAARSSSSETDSQAASESGDGQPANPRESGAIAELNEAFEAALADNRLLSPSEDNATYFLREMLAIDAANELTMAALDWLTTEMLGRAKQASEATDWAAAETWLEASASLGADPARIQTQRDQLAERMVATEGEKRLPASSFVVTNYTNPEYPRTALNRSIEGWVDVDFVVTATGETREVTVADASHERMFRNEAVAAVSSWRFEPREVMGRAIDQRAFTRLRFVLSE